MRILAHSKGVYIKTYILLSLLICIAGCSQSYKENKNVINDAGLRYESQLANYNNGNFVTEYQEHTFFLRKEITSNLYVIDAPLSSMKNLNEATLIAADVKEFFVFSSGILYTHNDEEGLFLMTAQGETRTIFEGSCKQINLCDNMVFFTDECSNIYKALPDCSDIELIYKNVANSNIDNLQPTNEGLYFRLWSSGINSIIFYSFTTEECNQILGVDAERFYVIGTYVYFVDSISTDLWRRDLKSGIDERLTFCNAVLKDSLCFYGDWMVYSEFTPNGGTKAYNLQTYESKEISNESYQFIFVVKNELITNEGTIPIPE